MKKDIHPTYSPTTFKCSCGATYTAGSSLADESSNVDICSNCHPFYTGKQKLVDTAGRVQKFQAKLEKAKQAQQKAEKKVKKVKQDEIEDALKEVQEEAKEEPKEEKKEEEKSE